MLDEFDTHPRTGHEEDPKDVQRLVAELDRIDLKEMCGDQLLYYNWERPKEWILTEETVEIEA